MTKKIIKLSFLLTLSYFLSGCNHYSVILGTNQLQLDCEDIEEVHLLDTDTVKFNSSGGVCYFLPDHLSGTIPNGTRVKKSLDEIRELRATVISQVPMCNVYDKFMSEVLLKNYDLVIFQGKGGRYMPAANAVKGLTSDGRTITIKKDDILEIYIDRPVLVTKSDFIYNEAKVRQVVTLSNKRINFDEDGASFFPAVSGIRGLSINEEPLYIHMDSIYTVKAAKTESNFSKIAGLVTVLILVTAMSVVSGLMD